MTTHDQELSLDSVQSFVYLQNCKIVVVSFMVVIVIELDVNRKCFSTGIVEGNQKKSAKELNGRGKQV